MTLISRTKIIVSTMSQISSFFVCLTNDICLSMKKRLTKKEIQKYFYYVLSIGRYVYKKEMNNNNNKKKKKFRSLKKIIIFTRLLKDYTNINLLYNMYNGKFYTLCTHNTPDFFVCFLLTF